MFQSFEMKSSPSKTFERVHNLRSCFDSLGMDAFLVPRVDEYRGEFVDKGSERLAWLSGFTGSAGIAIVLRQKSVIFVDGRYTLQVEKEVDTALFTIKNIAIEPLHAWISEHGFVGLRLGLDSRLHSSFEVDLLQKSLDKIEGVIVDVPYNPIDSLWKDRPQRLYRKVAMQDMAYAGRESQEKIRDICKILHQKEVGAVFICDPSSIAWIFNIRGFDIPCSPYPLSRAILYADGKAEIFFDKQYINEQLKALLSAVAIVLDMDMMDSRLVCLARTSMPILIDPKWISYRFFKVIAQKNGVMVEGSDPSCLLRATKNKVEIEGMQTAHIQDGVAMVYFLFWFYSQSLETITEIDIIKKLERCREEIGCKMRNPLRDIAFNTIAASGPHAAIIHYQASVQSNRLLQKDELLLLDSGAQYVNGTTDITRTIAIGDVDYEKKYYFTLVLKGMISVSTARFPQRTRGCDLDSIARIFLWKYGADFAHGVGHGVGSFLPVHEGPQGISRTNQEPLLPGMILSNEPGYYRCGAFGIRIENVLCVSEPETINNGECLMLGFNTLTLCPIDRKLILVELLTNEEKKWCNDYHRRVYTSLAPLIEDQEVLSWLFSVTAPI
ncbi:putative peptidase [Candidatus Liberibacter asiaticus]|uniref:aminopeptidase P family protein n=1 Tax=Liberibacter asiaticus TaxID=34021 RepID=UPI0012F4AAE0|nr:aminopeptidase P family protein [Candidatus Liberibacter asiaticus]KAE9515417.1 putative peptidase [Candidatus Liberibacter asiaticus]